MDVKKPKGKQATRGQKQIYEENVATIRFYIIMTLIGAVGFQVHVFISLKTLITLQVPHALLQYFLFESIFKHWLLFGVTLLLQVSGLLCMRHMAKATFDGSQMVDAGLDLNLEHGFGEYCKDAVILGFIVHIATLLTAYFWWLLALVPCTAVLKLWTNILSPWFFSGADAPQEEDDDKKKRKREKVKYKRI